MVNLQIGRIHLFQIYETLAAILRNELIFDLFGKARAPAESSELFLRRIGKTVGGNLPAIGRLDPKGFQLNAQLADIPRRTRRMIVAVFVLQFFRGDVAMLENVVNHRLGTLAGDGGAQFKKLFWVFWFCHKEQVFPSVASARSAGAGAWWEQLPIPPPAPATDIKIPPSFHPGPAGWPARNVRPQFPSASNAVLPAAACRSCDCPAARRSSPDSGHFSDSTPRVAPRNHQTQSRRNTASRVPRRRLDMAGPYRTRHPPPPFPAHLYNSTR